VPAVLDFGTGLLQLGESSEARLRVAVLEGEVDCYSTGLSCSVAVVDLATPGSLALG
jgi:hypothetical protein